MPRGRKLSDKTKIIGYFVNSYGNGDFCLMDFSHFKSSCNSNLAKHYLQTQIRQSILDDVLPIIQQPRGGFYSAIRTMFAEIDGLAKLYFGVVGDSDSIRVVRFMKKMFSGELGKYAGFIYEVYRHGLMHTHMPKHVFAKRKHHVGWGIRKNGNPTGALVDISLMELKCEVLNAIKKYCEELDRNKRRLRLFKNGYGDMARVLYQKDLRKRYSKPDFCKLVKSKFP